MEELLIEINKWDNTSSCLVIIIESYEKRMYSVSSSIDYYFRNYNFDNTKDWLKTLNYNVWIPFDYNSYKEKYNLNKLQKKIESYVSNKRKICFVCLLDKRSLQILGRLNFNEYIFYVFDKNSSLINNFTRDILAHQLNI